MSVEDKLDELKKKFSFVFPRKTILTKYPQLGYKENLIWTAFLKQVPWDDIEYIAYAVRVGKPYVPKFTTDESVLRMVAAVTTPRIDAVVYRKSEIWLMEIKEIVNLATLGQLLTYEHYFIQEYKPMKPVKLGVVASDYKIAVEEVLSRYNVTMFIIKYGKLQVFYP